MEDLNIPNEELNVLAGQWFAERIDPRLTILENIENAIAETRREERAEREANWPNIRPMELYVRMALLEQLREQELRRK